MPAVQETVDQVRRIDVDQYKYGFETLIESDKAPKGLSEDTVRFISAKKNEPEWMLAWRLDAYKRWLTMREPKWAKVEYGPIDYQDIYYYSAPKKKDGPKSLDEIDPEILRTYEKLGIPLREREALLGIQKPAATTASKATSGGGYGRVAVDAVFDSVSVATTFKAELAKAGVLFMPISEAVHEHPDLVKKYLGSVVPISDNFFATLNSAVFSDGSFVYVPPGVRCPMELSTYFRINEKQYRPVRAHADHRRQGLLCELSRRLHRADARREPASRRRGRAGRARRCRDQIFDHPELVSGRRRRAAAASTISSPSAAIAAARTRRFPGRRSKPAPPSPGNIRAASCAATIRAASSIRSRSPTATSRSIPAPRCCISARTRRAASSPRASPPGHSNNTYRGLVTAHRRASGARNFTNCDSLLIGDKCGAHTVPYIEAKNSSTVFEHEATTSKISEEMLFYCRQRGLSAEEATALVVNGFVKDVLQQLPMEFAVEAQKLISVSLEGSVRLNAGVMIVTTYWFRPRRYGYGATPMTWEGWAVTFAPWSS